MRKTAGKRTEAKAEVSRAESKAKAEQEAKKLSESEKRSLETHFILYLENCTARWKNIL